MEQGTGSENRKGIEMQYRLKIVFVDNQELILETTEKHGFSDDLELFEVTTVDEIFVVPLLAI